MRLLYLKRCLPRTHFKARTRVAQSNKLSRGAIGWPLPTLQRRLAHNPADNPDFLSVVDNPPNLVKSGGRHGPGLIILGRNAPSTPLANG